MVAIRAWTAILLFLATITFPMNGLAALTISSAASSNAVALNDATYDITGAFTIVAWVRWDGTLIDNCEGIFYKFSGPTYNGYRMYMCTNNTNKKSSLWCWVANGGALANANSPDVSNKFDVPSSTWHFTACAYNPSTEVKLLFRTATSTSWQKYTDTTAIPASVGTENSVAQIGNDAGTDVTSFFGQIAHVRVYQRYLTDDEILNLMYKPACQDEGPNLLGAWPLDNSAYSDDCSQTGVDGTNTVVGTYDGPPVR